MTAANPVPTIVVLVIGVFLLVAVAVVTEKVEIVSLRRTTGRPSGIVVSVESSEHPAHDVVEVASSMVLSPPSWVDIQDILCPMGKPQADQFGPKLFAMARAELGITTEEYRYVKEQNLDFHDPTSLEKLSYQFYHGRFANATIYTVGKNHSIAYIPIWKAANNAIRGWIKRLGREQGRVHSIRPENLFDDNSSSDDDNNNNDDDNSFRRPNCVVTAIRDPISHFLSGYNEIEFRRENLANNTHLPHYYGLPFHTEEQRQDRFVHFVRDFALEESRALVHEPFGHVFSMSRVLEVLHRQGGFLSGYLPSLANLSTAMPAFVQHTCHLEYDLPAMKDTRWGHLSSADPHGFYHAARTVWAEGGVVARALCIFHAMDYACWKNLPDGIPEICQEVYSRPEFSASIMNVPFP